jgi:TRAP-type C4-dicarboxylate transport system substrate-binding protein
LNKAARGVVLGFLLSLPVLAVSDARAAGPTVIKMATLAPEGSSWYKVLQKMGEGWKRATNGAVTLRIYPGGVSGDEDAVIRKMRVGQLQAAAVTGIGLSYLDRSFYALHIPMMYASDEEFDYVRDWPPRPRAHSRRRDDRSHWGMPAGSTLRENAVHPP